ncbi:hypothetical protein [Streptomyces sp. CS131]|uniref:hypothetical protein n=1 Tax=Streptomyces sp. CS131 TaxID=2162711 RepID=UPI000D51612A|nr:hypothetical protein [Streptomyces sp. CS131]PVC76930.1 hypothetical protein DBP20_35240 [Streptomyces sp. CS131]
MTETEETEERTLCAWCGTEFRQSGVGRTRDYCRRSCRQRAYEDRKTAAATREAVVVAVAAVMARGQQRTVSSRDTSGAAAQPSRDETAPARGQVVRPGTLSGRRPLLPPPPGVRRPEPPTLFDADSSE